MGNMCGCVRGTKEECYVDPNKAPLTPGPKEGHVGHRYFQRRKKRKSGEFHPGDSLRSRGGYSLQDESLAVSSAEAPVEVPEERDTGAHRKQAERPKLGRLAERGTYVGEVPVLFKSHGGVSTACRNKLALTHGARRLISNADKVDNGDSEDGRAAIIVATDSVERNLHGVTRAPRRVAPRDSLLEKRLLRRQLQRAVSFGAVEHMLRTLRAGSRDAEDRMLEDMKGLPRLISSTQLHRKRRRAHTCLATSASQDSMQDGKRPINITTINAKEVMYSRSKVSRLST